MADIQGKRIDTGASADIAVSKDRAMFIGNHLPLGAEVNRRGDRFILGNSAAITGIAPVQALPTTAAQWAISNPDNILSMFLEEVGMYLTAGTPGVGGTLLYCIFRLPIAVGAQYAGTSISSNNPASNKLSKAIVKASITITDAAAPNWYPVGTNFGSNVTAFAASTYLEHRDLQGRIVIPPLYSLGLAVVAPAGTTPLFAPFMTWVEAVGLN